MKEANDAELEVMDDKAELLERQNRNTAVERIAIYRQGQEKIHALAEKYRAMGLDDNSEYIRELTKQWWDYEDKIQDVYDEIADIVQKQADDIEIAANWMVKQIDRELEDLEKKKKAIEDERQQKIDDLQKQNDELEKQKELQNALNSLAQAQNRKNLIYKNGHFQYLADVEAISEAADKVDEINTKRKLEEQIEAIENYQDEEYEAILKSIKSYEEYKEAWENLADKYQEEQDRLIASEVLGIELEANNWKDRLDNAEEFVNKYNKLMDSLNDGSYKDNIGETIYPDSKTVTVGANSKAPPGLNIGDRVVTGEGTWMVTGFDSNGNYTSVLYDKNWSLPKDAPFSSAGNHVIIDRDGNWYYENNPDIKGGPSSSSGSSGSTSSGNQQEETRGGKTYAVKLDGTAPKGLKVGDKVATGGGTYLITGIDNNGNYINRRIDDRVYKGPYYSTDLSHFNLTGSYGYAKGTKNAKGGLSLVGEEGPEIRALNSGDVIFPNKMVNNLMSWGSLDPSALFRRFDKGIGSGTSIQIDNISLPNVSDAQQFVHELKRFATNAIQFGSA